MDSNNKNKRNDESIDNPSKIKATEQGLKNIIDDLADFGSTTKMEVDIKKPLGQGGFATVFLGIKDKRKFALKVILVNKENLNKDRARQEKQLSWANNEMIVSSNLKNKNCVRCYGAFNQTNSKILILEYAINRDLSYLCSLFYQEKLFSYVNIKKTELQDKNDEGVKIYRHQKYLWPYFMSENFIRFFVDQIIQSLEYLSHMNFLHRDLKLENLLLMSNFQIKLSDFALSTSIPQGGEFKLTNAGTSIYMAPENFDPNRKPVLAINATKLDYYALGVILYKLLTNEFVIKSNKDEDKRINFSDLKSKLDEIKKGIEFLVKKNQRPLFMTSNEIYDLSKRLLEPEIEKRANLQEILNHSWLKKNQDKIKLIHEIHENDYMKFLNELQKSDFSMNNIKREYKKTELTREESELLVVKLSFKIFGKKNEETSLNISEYVNKFDPRKKYLQNSNLLF